MRYGITFRFGCINEDVSQSGAVSLFVFLVNAAAMLRQAEQHSRDLLGPLSDCFKR